MSVELRDVYLHGSLRLFGRHFRLAVATPAEAVRALCLQIKGLRVALREGFYRVVVGAPGRRRDRTEDQLNVGFDRSVHIVPVIAGASGRGLGIGLAVAGTALLATAFAPAALSAAGLLYGSASSTVLGVSTSTIGLFGAALTLQGVSMLLAPKPALSGGVSKNDNSFLFGGVPDRPVSGRVVPVVFGTYRVQCIPISVQLKNVRLGNQAVRRGADKE